MCASLTNHASTKKLERQRAAAHSRMFDSKTTFEQRNTIQMVCLSTSKKITERPVWETSTIDAGGVERQNESHRGARAFWGNSFFSVTDFDCRHSAIDYIFCATAARSARQPDSPVPWLIQPGPVENINLTSTTREVKLTR
jgi:hypothetical protein